MDSALAWYQGLTIWKKNLSLPFTLTGTLDHVQHLYRKEVLTHGNQVGKLKTILDKTKYGPGCNHLKFDFMEELLKILYFFGLNLECIFNYH